MAMKEYSTLPRSLEPEPYNQIQFNDIPRTPYFLREGLLRSEGDAVSVFCVFSFHTLFLLHDTRYSLLREELLSFFSQNPQVRPKRINLHLSNIRKWSNAVETMRTLRRYIKNEVAETNEVLIGYMLSIDFALLQAMYRIIRRMLPATSEITELDAPTKYKVSI